MEGTVVGGIGVSLGAAVGMDACSRTVAAVCWGSTSGIPLGGVHAVKATEAASSETSFLEVLTAGLEMSWAFPILDPRQGYASVTRPRFVEAAGVVGGEGSLYATPVAKARSISGFKQVGLDELPGGCSLTGCGLVPRLPEPDHLG